MFDSIEKVRKLQQIAQDPTESEIVQALVSVIVGLEMRQLDAVQDLHDAHGIDGVDVQASESARRDQLLGLVDAIASDNFRGWWFEEVISEHIENPEDAAAYAGLSEEEWEEQIANWAETYRTRGGEDFEQHSDRDIARLHVERTFGVSLREFEREVVGFSRSEAMQTVLAGNFEAVEQGIRAATATAENDEGEQ